MFLESQLKSPFALPFVSEYKKAMKNKLKADSIFTGMPSQSSVSYLYFFLSPQTPSQECTDKLAKPRPTWMLAVKERITILYSTDLERLSNKEGSRENTWISLGRENRIDLVSGLEGVGTGIGRVSCVEG